MSDRDRDVVIVGAGLAGSSLAASLASVGWDVLLVERRRFPRHKVCGEFLSPDGVDALDGLGLTAAVRALSPAEMHVARIVSPSGRTVQTPLPGTAFGVSRYVLDGALAGAAARAGADVRMGAAVSSRWTAEDGAFCVDIADKTGSARRGGTIVRARAVVLACGRHFSRRLTGTGTPAKGPHGADDVETTTARYVGVKCHYEGVDRRPEVELFFFPGGYAGVAPTEMDGTVNVCALATRRAFHRAGGYKEALLRAAIDWNPALGRRLAGGRPRAGSAVATSPVVLNRAPTPWSDGAPHVGDAAVMLPPFVGDGMASALRSAELCAPLAHAYLSGRLSLVEWERLYRAAWHAEFDRRLRTGRRLGRMLSRPVAADACLSIAARFPPLARHFMRATRGAGRAPVPSV